MKIIAYTYEADAHCAQCAINRFGVNELQDITRNYGYGSTHRFSDGIEEQLDEHLIPIETRDNEGNPVHPIFSTDEQLEPLHCGDCLELISQPTRPRQPVTLLIAPL